MGNIPGGLALPPGATENKIPSQNATKLSDLRLSQDFQSMADVAKVVTTVKIGKPHRQIYFRVHPEWQMCYPVLDYKNEGRSDFYIVDTKKVPDIQDEVSLRLVVPAITSHEDLYIWPLRLPGEDGKLDEAGTSSLEAMRIARTQWIKLRWNGHRFETFVAKTMLKEPEWPETTFERMLDIAFADRIITSPDHRVVKLLMGDM